MANRIKSAIKQHRQSLKRRARNLHVKTSLRTLMKKLNAQVANGDDAASKALLIELNRAIDKAATKGVLHKKTASRYVSRFSKKVSKLAAQASS